MKEITILSGKGGTGKTSITAALASVAKNSVFTDSDVDAADLHLILHPEIKETHPFISGLVASIDTEKCTGCDLCRTYCRFDAIRIDANGAYHINPFQCEGCRLCERVCTDNAVEMQQNDNNFWFVSSTRFGPLVHARMGPGEENSGKLVTQVRKHAKEIALNIKADYILTDGPPGVGCATISSISGTDSVLLVIEPSKSSLHDAERLINLVELFAVPAYAIINKHDINSEIATEIEAFLNLNDIPLLAKIPFTEQFVEAMIEGKSIVEYEPGTLLSKQIRLLWKTLQAQN